MTTRKLVGLGVAVILALGALAATLGAAAASITLVSVLTGLASPVFVTNARDGSHRLFIVEPGGVIKVLQLGASSPTVFLDIGGKVLFGGEQGLLGLTFHPQFSSNRRFFGDYPRQPDGATVIAEYRASPADPNVADSAETVLLVIPQPFANHNGGMVEFGPCGILHNPTRRIRLHRHKSGAAAGAGGTRGRGRGIDDRGRLPPWPDQDHASAGRSACSWSP